MAESRCPEVLYDLIHSLNRAPRTRRSLCGFFDYFIFIDALSSAPVRVRTSLINYKMVLVLWGDTRRYTLFVLRTIGSRFDRHSLCHSSTGVTLTWQIHPQNVPRYRAAGGWSAIADRRAPHSHRDVDEPFTGK